MDSLARDGLWLKTDLFVLLNVEHIGVPGLFIGFMKTLFYPRGCLFDNVCLFSNTRKHVYTDNCLGVKEGSRKLIICAPSLNEVINKSLSLHRAFRCHLISIPTNAHT